jgi:hypothetical protein
MIILSWILMALIAGCSLALTGSRWDLVMISFDHTPEPLGKL